MDWELLASAGLALAIVNIKFEPTLFQRAKAKLVQPHRNKELVPVRPVFPVKKGNHVSWLAMRLVDRQKQTLFLDFDGVGVFQGSFICLLIKQHLFLDLGVRHQLAYSS